MTVDPDHANASAAGPALADDPLRDALLEATLPNVAFDGWTRQALLHGAARIGEQAATAEALFPRLPRDLLVHFSDWADRRMIAAIDAERAAFDDVRVRDRVTACVLARLDALEPHKDATRRAVTLLALPGQAGLAARLLWQSVDRMWDLAGDTATDHNRYTKRALLAGVQSATLLCWLGDDSPGHETTRAFLDRRIDEVLRLGRATGPLIGRVVGLAATPCRLAGTLRTRLRAFGDA